MWVLTACVWGIWGHCFHEIQNTHRSEASCYRSVDSIHKVQGTDAFTYMTCQPVIVELSDDR